MRTPTRLALVAFVTLALSPCASANLVTNPGFEDGGGSYSGWTLNPGGGNPGLSPAFAHSGAAGAYFPNLLGSHPATLLSQDLATISGATYTLSFWLQCTNQFSPLNNNFIATFGGTPVFSLTNAAPFGYTMYTFNVVASSALTTLQFSFLSLDHGAYAIDDISVEFLSGPSSVPETGSTLAILGLALVAIEALRRKLAAV